MSSLLSWNHGHFVFPCFVFLMQMYETRRLRGQLWAPKSSLFPMAYLNTGSWLQNLFWFCYQISRMSFVPHRLCPQWEELLVFYTWVLQWAIEMRPTYMSIVSRLREYPSWQSMGHILTLMSRNTWKMCQSSTKKKKKKIFWNNWLC